MKQSMKKFMTRANANAGVRVPILGPDGKDSGEWIHVLGVDSDAFRRAKAVGNREVLEARAKWDETNHKPTAEEAADVIQTSRLNLLCSLVTDWSLEEPCTPENVRTLFIEAPAIAEYVDTVSAQRNRFFTQGSPASGAGSESKAN